MTSISDCCLCYIVHIGIMFLGCNVVKMPQFKINSTQKQRGFLKEYFPKRLSFICFFNRRMWFNINVSARHLRSLFSFFILFSTIRSRYYCENLCIIFLWFFFLCRVQYMMKMKRKKIWQINTTRLGWDKQGTLNE